MRWLRETPWWVWTIGTAFALAQPLSHLAILYCGPADAIPTGLQKPDSVIFIHAMRMFENNFFSPYATCHSPFGQHSVRLFAVPFYVLYGVAGLLATQLHLTDFLMLGCANGISGLCFLVAAYHFMRAILPSRANVAFVLYAFAGGLGGPIYLLASATGATSGPTFERWFYRFAIYDLVEGSNLAPYLMMARLYYTGPLAIGLAGLTILITQWRGTGRHPIALAYALLAVCTLLNARFGPPLWGIAALYLWQHHPRPLRTEFAVAAPLIAGMLATTLYMAMSPAFFSNYVTIVRQGMWFSSYLSAAFPSLMCAAPVIIRESRSLPRKLAVPAYAAVGFLVAFSVLFVSHQLYFGTLLIGSDHAAAVRMSDFAAVAAVFAAGYAVKRKKSGDASELGWIVTWLLLYTALALAAFGQGWFLRFSPQRLMMFLGIPLSLLAAENLARLRAARPRLAAGALAGSVACGLISFTVSTLVFQGPLGMSPGIASSLGMNVAYMPRADYTCLTDLEAGVVAAPRPFNDILSLRADITTLGGFGAAGLSDQPSGLLDDAVAQFFAIDCAPDIRRAFLAQWCVRYVYLPSAAKDAADLAAQFDGMSELRQVAAIGAARLYAVRR